MSAFAELLLFFLMFTNLVLVGLSRLPSCVRVVAAQGVAAGLLSIVLPHEDWLRPTVLGAMSMGIKGFFFPWLLNTASRRADIRNEVEPIISYPVSILVGLFIVGSSLWLAPQLNLDIPVIATSVLLLPTGVSTLLIGLLLITTRRNALNQVLGYIVLENGIYLFGISLALDEPFLVEMGVLLDVFVGVFVMGITVFHIQREFDRIAVDPFTESED